MISTRLFTRKMPATIIALGLTSFFTDFSSEMIYPLLPVFLVSVLGGGAMAVGLTEGLAEATAALVKAASGLWTDRVRRRKPFLLAGYGLAGLVRPLIGLAAAWPTVTAIRFADRVGKGLRTSPRDALIAEAASPNQWGQAFGFHRAMDHAGAVVGPLVAAGLLAWAGLSLRQVFLLAAIPAGVVMIVLLGWVKEPARRQPKEPGGQPRVKASLAELGRDYRLFLLALLIFTLGNSSDAFLLLKLSQAGLPAAWLAVLWACHHLVKMAACYLGGALSDSLGRRPMIVAGWLFYAAVYLAFALIQGQTGLIAVFLAYGLYFGLTEPAEKALVADLVPERVRGAAFGFYHGAVGLAALPASLIFGLLWQAWGAGAAFLTGAGLAAIACFILLFIPSGRPAQPGGPAA